VGRGVERHMMKTCMFDRLDEDRLERSEWLILPHDINEVLADWY